MSQLPENLKDLYDEQYVRKLHARQETVRIRPILASVDLPRDARVLDVGCGNGPLAGILSSRVAEYHGVDFSEAFISFARAASNQAGLVNCHFHCAEIEAFVEDHAEEFDLVFALDVSEHVRDREWASIVSSMRRALKPGGSIILHTPNLDFFVERMKERNFILRQFPEHVAVRTIEQNASFFDAGGFSRVKVSHLAHYNMLSVLHPLSRLPRVGRYFAARILLTATR